MKNPLSVLSELFQTTLVDITLTEAVTLEFCYDHINEDYPVVCQEVSQPLQQGDFHLIETRKLNND